MGMFLYTFSNGGSLGKTFTERNIWQIPTPDGTLQEDAPLALHGVGPVISIPHNWTCRSCT